MKIISIGEAKKMLPLFSNKCQKISIDTEDADIIIENYIEPEEYEEKYKEIKELNSIKNENIIFILFGGGTISGAALRILEQLRENKLFIFYIIPDCNDLCKTDQMQENLTFGVLQEYTFSGLFEKMYIVENKNFFEYNQNVSLRKIYDVINNQIISTFEYVNFLHGQKPIFETGRRSETKFVTLGLTSLFNENDFDFFSFENVDAVRYHIAIKKEDLDDIDILQKIKAWIGVKKEKTNYEIHFSLYEDEKNQMIIKEIMTNQITQRKNGEKTNAN